MNKKWESVIRIIVSAIAAIITALTTTSCIGHGPITFLAML